MRRGQVAIYLALVLVVITLLVLMNVSVFLGVSAKNVAMNAGDAAAIAVANHQRDLLNRIGRLNIEHLKAAVRGDSAACESTVLEQQHLCFLGPLEGVSKGNAAAKKESSNLIPNDDMAALLREHAIRVRTVYAMDEDRYPEPWKGAWEAYASALEVSVSSDLYACPTSLDFMDPIYGHVLFQRDFYEAIDGRNWCAFKLYFPGLLDNYTSFRDWGPLPSNDLETRRRKCVNSEVYSLGLELRIGSAMQLLGKELIAYLTGYSEAELVNCPLLSDQEQSWFFFDRSVWRMWDEMHSYNGSPFVGPVKSEYDVAGCFAGCKVSKAFTNLVEEGLVGMAVWASRAKPFGKVTTVDGDIGVVTSLGGFVTEAFSESKLVYLPGDGSGSGSAADVDLINHINKHLAAYCQVGPNLFKNCYYCRQLVQWERPSFRSEGRRWLKLHGSECFRLGGTEMGVGGIPYAH